MERKWTYEECIAEARYIASINPAAPGKTFNHDTACFVRYCDMQQDTVERSGYRQIAHDIRQARDIGRCYLTRNT